ncbi:MAG TPA: hypothetical protein VEA69_19535 [Tepidisphaeraceae bacterium]|nr:hypothetical protein [Tepidisphaeraceae bacterium]
MPIGFHPDQTVWISLDIDRALPEETRPAFRCRFLTEGDVLRLIDLHEAARAMSDREAAKALNEAMAVHVTGWRNQDPRHGEYRGAPSLTAALTLLESYELVRQAIDGTGAGEVALKKASALPSPSSTESSAPPVAAGNA